MRIDSSDDEHIVLKLLEHKKSGGLRLLSMFLSSSLLCIVACDIVREHLSSLEDQPQYIDGVHKTVDGDNFYEIVIF